MNQYVNTEALSEWYRSVSKDAWDERRVLDEVFRQFIEKHQEVFVIAAEHSKTGKEEAYPFRFQHYNCCGSDQIIISF